MTDRMGIHLLFLIPEKGGDEGKGGRKGKETRREVSIEGKLYH